MIQDVQDQVSFDQALPTNRNKRRSLLNIQQSVKISNDLSTLPERQPSGSRECRICLESQTADDNQLVTPCRCTGSVKYVHDVCYRRWIERLYQTKDKREQNAMLSQGVQCQICKYKVMLNFTTKYTCKRWESFKAKVSNNRFLFVLFITFLILNAGSLSYLVVYTAGQFAEVNNNLISLILVISSFVFLAITLIITLYYFLSDYFVEKILRLLSYQVNNKPKPIVSMTSRYQVHPISVEELAE